MRILLLNYEFPPIGGGAATASAHIAHHLAQRGVEVAVLTSHWRGLARREVRDGYTIHRARTLRSRADRCSLPEMGAFILGSALPALNLVNRFKPDLLHVYFGMPTGLVGLMVHLLARTPYLLSLRGGDVPGFLGGELALAHRLTLPLTRTIWSHAGKLVVNSRGLHQLATRTLTSREIEIIPNGVDLQSFQPGLRSTEGEGKVRLLFVGRLVRQKGLIYLLQGLARLDPATLRHVEVELAGSGPEGPRLRSLVAELGLQGVVRFAEWVPRGEIASHYQRADAFVFPSLDEGMPNAMLEAMACGLPILATDIRGNNELVQPGVNGILVPPADPEALAGAIHRIVADPSLRRDMGEQSRLLAARHDWSKVAERYLALSEDIAGKGRAH